MSKVTVINPVCKTVTLQLQELAPYVLVKKDTWDKMQELEAEVGEKLADQAIELDACSRKIALLKAEVATLRGRNE